MKKQAAVRDGPGEPAPKFALPNDRFAKHFIGQSYLVTVSTEQVKIFNVAL